MNNDQSCSFCGKNRLNVKKLIAGPEAFICDECILLSSEILSREKKDDVFNNELSILSPKKIKAEFDKYVVGQEDAKKTLSVVVNNHYKRLLFQNNNEIKEGKTNLLLIGPTSSGKTLLIKVLQKIMSQYNIPVAFADATTLTEAGYVGDDVENILLRLLQEADFNVGKAQRGIIFIDEIDKISLRSGSSSMTRDVSGEGVQQALLGILQGKIASVSQQGGRKHPNQEMISINTTDILFICAGAFSGLEKIIQERDNIETIGFHGLPNADKIKKSYKKVEVDDLIKFGMIPEFIGRLPVFSTLDELSEDQLVEVLKTPRNSLVKQYEKLFEANNAKLTITSDALKVIAQKAIKKQVSARGLSGVIEDILKDIMFDLEDHTPCEIIIDKEAAENNKPIVKAIKNEENKKINNNNKENNNTTSVAFKI